MLASSARKLNGHLDTVVEENEKKGLPICCRKPNAGSSAIVIIPKGSYALGISKSIIRVV